MLSVTLDVSVTLGVIGHNTSAKLVARTVSKVARDDSIRLDCHQIRFFRGQGFVGFGNVFIGQLLNIFLRLALLVFADFFIFQ